MKYICVTFSLEPLLPAREVLIAELAEAGFESFEETENGLKAFIAATEFDRELLNQLSAASIPDQLLTFLIEEMAEQNWNAQWEKNFDPIVIADRCLIKAPFHKGIRSYPLEILIEPKMSFGTGHHATTHLMIAAMLDMEWQDKKVLDMGSGTGVLAIAASKLGASHCDAIDIDEWAFENAGENVERNNCKNIYCIKGGVESIPKSSSYDVILANINRNILTRDMQNYCAALSPAGQILFSGFYIHDKDEIESVARPLGLNLMSTASKDEWCMLHYRYRL